MQGGAAAMLRPEATQVVQKAPVFTEDRIKRRRAGSSDGHARRAYRRGGVWWPAHLVVQNDFEPQLSAEISTSLLFHPTFSILGAEAYPADIHYLNRTDPRLKSRRCGL